MIIAVKQRALPYILILLFTLLYLWFYRATVFAPFNREYLLDLYQHSQWMIAGNIRSIGDDGLYQATALQLLSNPDPYSVNAEAPPLGKYLYAVAIKFTNTPYTVPALLFPFTALLFYNLSKFFIKQPKFQMLALVLFLMDPLVLSQISLTMLDLPLLFVLIAHIFAVIRITNSKNNKKTLLWTLLAGITLGLAISIKFGVTMIALVIADIWLLEQSKQRKNAFVLIIIAPITYIIITLPYLLTGHTLQQWIATQKYVINFYLLSKTPRDPAVVFVSLLSPLFKGWWNNGWQFTSEWTILWLLQFLIFLLTIWRFIKRKVSSIDPHWRYLSYMLVLLLLIYAAVPFWTRYLLLIIPFLILYLVQFISEHKINRYLSSLILFVLICQWILFLRPQPTLLISQIQESMQLKTYQDLYQSLLQEDQTTSADNFWRTNLSIDNQLLMQQITATASAEWVWPWQNQTTAQLKMVRETTLGPIQSQNNLTLKRVANKWRLKWDWETKAPGYNPNTEISTDVQYGKPTLVFSKNLITIAQEADWPTIYVTAKDVQNEETLVHDIALLTGLKRHQVQSAFIANYPYDWPAPVAPLLPDYDYQLFLKVWNYPGVSIKPKQRVLGVGTNLIKQGLLPKFNEEIQKIDNPISEPGGFITLHHPENNSSTDLIRKQPKDGRNITLPFEL